MGETANIVFLVVAILVFIISTYFLIRSKFKNKDKGK